MHWYVSDPAWTAEEGERQLKLMANAHVGGVLLFPTYPIFVDNIAQGNQNQSYLSAAYLETLRDIRGACRRAGLTFDMVLGTGSPYGGPSVSLDQSAHALRMLQAGGTDGAGNTPVLREGEHWVTTSGTPGPHFYSAPTRMEVKRAALGAEGWVVDHYNPEAVRQFLRDVGDKLLAAIPKGEIPSVFCDSFEVYRATWTAKLPEIFSRVRGYDLLPQLPALFDANHPPLPGPSLRFLAHAG
jgi:hypothetical protein